MINGFLWDAFLQGCSYSGETLNIQVNKISPSYLRKKTNLMRYCVWRGRGRFSLDPPGSRLWAKRQQVRDLQEDKTVKGKGGIGRGRSSAGDSDLLSEMKGGREEVQLGEENLRQTQWIVQNRDCPIRGVLHCTDTARTCSRA